MCDLPSYIYPRRIRGVKTLAVAQIANLNIACDLREAQILQKNALLFRRTRFEN